MQQIRFITRKDPEALEVLRHTAAHVMAQAVCNLRKGALLTIGPVIEDGFYYDFDMNPYQKKIFLTLKRR
jgi:threonyl-tRNA synthetase